MLEFVIYTTLYGVYITLGEIGFAELVGKNKSCSSIGGAKMVFRAFARRVYKFMNIILRKFGFILQRSNNNYIDFITDCSYLPYDVEYKSSSENITKMLLHIVNIWESYGQDETYWSVLTADSFLKENINKDIIENFYDTGKSTMRYIENTLKRCDEWEKLSRQNCMEYGCGVGRVTVQLAKVFKNVTGLDISHGHLKLAEKRINNLCITNINFQRVQNLDELGQLPKYDFIFSVIVLQHNPPPVIAVIIETFFKLLKVSGSVMFQIPVQIKDYSFSISDYLKDMQKYDTMEMHMLPQDKILAIARKNDCSLLECHNDGWVGSPNSMISQTFVFKRVDKKYTGS